METKRKYFLPKIFHGIEVDDYEVKLLSPPYLPIRS